MSPDGFTLLKLSQENQESPANYIFLIDSRRAVTDVCTLKGSWTLCSSNLIWKMTSVLVTPAHIFPGLLLPLLPVWRGDPDSVSCLRLLETNGSFLLQFWKCRMKGCRAIHVLHRSNERITWCCWERSWEKLLKITVGVHTPSLPPRHLRFTQN